ncbi:hypothetical protein HDF11_004357 [Tunturiibacter psychrotolerans]
MVNDQPGIYHDRQVVAQVFLNLRDYYERIARGRQSAWVEKQGKSVLIYWISQSETLNGWL